MHIGRLVDSYGLDRCLAVAWAGDLVPCQIMVEIWTVTHL